MNVYSTVAGQLPLMVRNGTPECFIPYSQALEMAAEIKRLKKELVKMQDAHEEALSDRGQQRFGSGYDMGFSMGRQITDFKVDQVRDSATALQKTVDAMLEYAAKAEASK